MAHINYLTMNFEDLFHAVFDDFGQMKNCGRYACSEFIDRLEHIYGKASQGKFGDKAVGRLNQKAAYEAAYKYLYK